MRALQQSTSLRGLAVRSRRGGLRSTRATTVVPAAHKVEITGTDGVVTTLEVSEDETVLDVALEQGLDLVHDCKMGVCMTCPAKVVSGTVDENNIGMLSDDVAEKGYALLCCAQPTSDLTIQVIEEEELLEQQLGA
eukprot:CAMPEP_0170142798 /NCGR_PEP_ID=MMETSP0033_2-20121228/8559_1 /TAXON_ID=195969 /ORGANISM="Dolichomastix tenuilepis, Strain CCMP3274" /LENGTH=135 /DNA_ID=CAMNT_0010379173 /DNA_START=6 /DNA_END=413 /DNA_ORIENTATION=+